MFNFWKIFFGFTLIAYAGFVAAFGYFSAVVAPADQEHPPGVVVPVYWNEAESQRLEYDFSSAEAKVEELESRGLKATIAMGIKLPGESGPECFFPQWYDHTKNQPTKDKYLFQMLRTTIIHFRNNPTVAAWQVEDNALHSAEGCPEVDEGLLRAEEALAQGLNSNDLPVYAEYHRPKTLPAFWNWFHTKIVNNIGK